MKITITNYAVDGEPVYTITINGHSCQPITRDMLFAELRGLFPDKIVIEGAGGKMGTTKPAVILGVTENSTGIGTTQTWWEKALPYPATDLFELCEKEGVLPSAYVERALAYAQEHGWLDVAEIIGRYNDICAYRRGELPYGYVEGDVWPAKNSWR